VTILSIDLETRSPVDLKRSGAYRYFEHPYTEILCAAWAIDDGPVQVWYPGDRCPDAVIDATAHRCEVSGWNVNFERQGWNRILGPRHGWPVPRLDQYRDTAAQAAAQALPRSLEKAANALRMPERKDRDGAKLMLQMARPRKRHKGEVEQIYYWHEGNLDRLGEYCAMDVTVERAIRRKLRPLSGAEFTLWRFDQLINDRGITLDRDLVADMNAIVDQYIDGLNAELDHLTEGNVTACSQTPSLKAWLLDHGVMTKSLAKNVIDTVMSRDMPAECHRALELWHEASKASVRKLQAAQLCVNGDGRARGLLLFHGATSGRWSGQLFQPQNLPRGSGTVDQEQAIRLIRHRDVNTLAWAYDRPLVAISDCLRGIMTAAPGKLLVAGDYVSIEARITAWLAGASEKLQQFIAQDNGTGAEVYRLAASRIYGIPVTEITSEQRQTGKTAELALGFGGGVNALSKMALNYHIDMADAFDALWESADAEEREKSHARYAEVHEKGNDDGLPSRAWQACWLTVRAWRRANKPIVAMWDAFHRAAWNTLEAQGVDHTAGPVTFRREGGFLWLTLPSGRKLAYPTPLVENLEVPWSDKRQPENEREHRDMLTVLAFEKGKALRYPFYPGLTFQHTVQAIARDILANGMHKVEAAGYPVVMSIHDEVICEVSQDPDIGQFEKLLCDLPNWADGLPLVAEAWSGFRYRKS
jgi:DNA polymerase bacteriophage-type